MLAGSGSHCKAASKRRQLLGKPVCHHGFRVLIGIGSSRFRTLRKAAAAAAAAAAAEPCPIDGRFMRFGGAESESTRQIMMKRQHVAEFLQELYEPTAEPMPGLSAAAKKGNAAGLPQFKRQQGRRPHCFRERESRSRQASRSGRNEMRHLPPGSFQDYHELFCAWLTRHGYDGVGIRLFKTAPRMDHKSIHLTKN